MFKRFKPDVQTKTVYEIDYKELFDKGIRGLIFDIDNTLVEDEALIDENAINLLKSLKDMGFVICIVSNNDKKRVEEFSKAPGIMFIYDAHKPSKVGFKRAIKHMKTNASNTIAIGDQIFTDIYGANRAGIQSYLCKPLNLATERRHIKLKRFFEKLVFPKIY